MKNYAAFILSIALLVGLGFGFSSCKEDEPPVPPKLGFAETSMTVDEGDGTIEVEVVLDKPYSKDLTIEYELGGTASDQDAVGTAGADYEVDGRHGVVEIRSGQTSGVIEIDIYNDAAVEEDETIEISIVDINTSDVELTADDEMEITITSDDVASQLSFSNQTMTVNEADQAIQVELVLDKPAPEDLTIQYELRGSATDTLNATQQLAADYKILGTHGEFVIEAGQTSGVIEILLYSDLDIEDANPATQPLDPETIVISVINTNAVEIADNELEILVEQEDGLLIALYWPDPVQDPAGTLQADMDLLLRVGTSTTNWLGVITGSASDSYEGPEVTFIPNAINFPAYGLSYTYYAGTLDTLNFEVVFIDFIDGAVEPEANTLSYEATYTAANKNAWTDVSSTKVVQTFEKTSTGFTTPSAIVVPTEGSRIASYDNFTSNLRRGDIQWSNNLKRMLKKYRPK
jgi:hypothetical protein